MRPAVYGFSGVPPFWPDARPVGPLPLDNPFGPRTRYARLNPAVREVIYPGGASYANGQWVISFGINDEHCALAIIPHTDVLRFTRPVTSPLGLAPAPHEPSLMTHR